MLAAFLPAAALAQAGAERAPPGTGGQPGGQAERQAERRAPPDLPALMKALKEAASPEDAERLAREIQTQWARSGSATADLLYQRSGQAVEDGDLDTAGALLEKLTQIAPRFADGWHQRATVAAEKQDYDQAILALRQTLALQPDHFIALAKLGGILEEFGDKPHALEAFRKALELNPHLEGLPDHMRELERDVEGRGI